MSSGTPSHLTHISFGKQVIDLACENVLSGERPFAALIAEGDRALVHAVNVAGSSSDPTDHAELRAIRALTSSLCSEELSGLTMYASCEPCVMCASAIRWAKLEQVFYCFSREDAARYGFADVVEPPLARSVLSPLPAVHLAELTDAAAIPFVQWRELHH